MRPRPTLLQILNFERTPVPGQYWPVVKYHAGIVYMTLWIYAIITFLDWILQ